MLPKSSAPDAEKLLLKLIIHLFSGSHSEPGAPVGGGEGKGGYLPRNAEGGKVESPTHREEEQESRNGKTEKETSRVTQYLIQRKIE